MPSLAHKAPHSRSDQRISWFGLDKSGFDICYTNGCYVTCAVLLEGRTMPRRSRLFVLPLAALLALWGCASGPLPGDLRDYSYVRGVRAEDLKAAHAELEQRLSALTAQLSDGFGSDRARRIAVLSFESTTDQSPNSRGAYLAEKVTHLLYATRRGTIVERTFLNKVVDEIERGYSGRFDALSLQEVGHLLNADTLILGSYTNLTGGLVEVMARAVAVETGEVVGAASTTMSSNLLPNIPIYQRQPLQAKAEIRPPAQQGGGTLNIIPSPIPSPTVPDQPPVMAYATAPTSPTYPTPQFVAPAYGSTPTWRPSYPSYFIPRLTRPWGHSGSTFRGGGGGGRKR